jgi:hypothetical protein
MADQLTHRQADPMRRTDEPRDELYRTDYDKSGPETISTTVVLAACEVNGMDPADAPPLSEVIEPSSLDRLFNGTVRSPSERTTRVIIPYLGNLIVVDGAGWIGIYRWDDQADSIVG